MVLVVSLVSESNSICISGGVPGRLTNSDSRLYTCSFANQHVNANGNTDVNSDIGGDASLYID